MDGLIKMQCAILITLLLPSSSFALYLFISSFDLCCLLIQIKLNMKYIVSERKPEHHFTYENVRQHQ